MDDLDSKPGRYPSDPVAEDRLRREINLATRELMENIERIVGLRVELAVRYRMTGIDVSDWVQPPNVRTASISKLVLNAIQASDGGLQLRDIERHLRDAGRPAAKETISSTLRRLKNQGHIFRRRRGFWTDISQRKRYEEDAT